jgi:putative transposase
VVSPQAKRNAVSYLRSQHQLSERKACGLTVMNRTTCRYRSLKKEEDVEKRLKELAMRKKEYGYRRIYILLKKEGYRINHKKVYRIYVKNDLSKRRKSKKKQHIVRCRRPLEKATRPNQRWAMDFMADSCSNGTKLRTLNIIDVFARECPAIVVGRSMPSSKVVAILNDLAKERGLPEAITIDNGPEYTSKVIQEWAKERGIMLDYITPGKPTENGYIESFNGKFREECLDQHMFKDVQEAAKIIESWREEYNNHRPHSSLGYLTPKEFLREYSCSNALEQVANL